MTLLIQAFPQSYEERKNLVVRLTNVVGAQKKILASSKRAQKRIRPEESYFSVAFQEATGHISLQPAEMEWLCWKVGKSLHVREVEKMNLSPEAEFINREFVEQGENEKPAKLVGRTNEVYHPRSTRNSPKQVAHAAEQLGFKL